MQQKDAIETKLETVVTNTVQHLTVLLG